MPAIPVPQPLGYLGVIFFLFGFFLILTGIGIVQLKEITVKQGRKTSWFGIFFVVIGVLFLTPDIINSINSASLSATVTPLPTETQITIEKTSTPDPQPSISSQTATLEIPSNPDRTNTSLLKFKIVIEPDWGCKGFAQNAVLSLYLDNSFTSNQGGGGVWTISNNEIKLSFTNGTEYSGVIENEEMNGEMISSSGDTGCWTGKFTK